MEPTKVLFLNHRRSACGVYEFGRSIHEAIAKSKRYSMVYVEVDSADDVAVAIGQSSPTLILVNYHPFTTRAWFPFALPDDRVSVVGIIHEISPEDLGRLNSLPFDYFMVHDPTLKVGEGGTFTSVRPLPPLAPNATVPPAQVTIGSFGFATPGKGFEALVARTQLEFEECHIRLNIPFSTFFDVDGNEARTVAERCRSLLWRPGVSLEVTHDYLEEEQLLGFLQGNSMNAFFYEPQCSRGLSSALDWALAAGRPLALRKADMFRHLFGTVPSPFVEDRSMKEIIQDGIGWQERLRQEWSAERILADYEWMFDRLLPEENSFEARRDLAARRRLRGLQSSIGEREGDLAEARTALKNRDEELQKSKEALAEAFASLQKSMQDNERLAYDLQESERVRGALLSSTSWRYTKPLRWVSRRLRRSTG